MASVPKVDYLKNNLHYACKRTSKKKKFLNTSKDFFRSEGNYINDLCTIPYENRTECLNKMIDAKFKPLKLKNIVQRTLGEMKEF